MNKLFCFLLFLFSMASYADDSSIDIDASKKSFVVSFNANPTTGYQWSVVQYDKNLLTLSKSEYQKLQTNLIGSGGHMVFTFTLNEGKTFPASTKMVFKYARSWEPESATVKNLTVNFVKTGDFK